MGALDTLSVCMLVTNDVSRDARVRKEARSIAEAGARVTVVGTGTGPVDASLVAEPFAVTLVEPPTASTHPSWFARVSANLRVEREFDRRLEAAAVEVGAQLVHANDLDTLLPGSRAAKRTGARLIYDAHELSTEGGNYNWWRKPLMERRERTLIRTADAVITVNTPIARELASRHGVALPKVVYNGASACTTDPQPVHSPVRLFFQGQFFADRNLVELIEAMEGLRGRAVLTLQGWGGVEEELHALVARLGLGDTVRFIDRCMPAEVVACCTEHDLGVINHKAISMNHLYSSPNKLFDYMAGGLAIAATDLPVFREILGETGCGVTFEQQGAQHTAAVLGELVDDPARIAQMKRAAVEACPRYAWDAQAEVLVGVYRDVSRAAGLMEG